MRLAGFGVGLADGLRHGLQFVGKQGVDALFDGIFGDEVVNLGDFLLAEAVDAADALLDGHGIPWQVVIEQNAGALEIDAFAASGGGNEELGAVFIPKAFGGFDLVFQGPAFDGGELVIAEDLRQFDAEEFQGFAILGEDDEAFALILAAQVRDDGEEAVEFAVGGFGHQADQITDARGFVGDFGVGIDAFVAFLVGIERPFGGFLHRRACGRSAGGSGRCRSRLRRR